MAIGNSRLASAITPRDWHVHEMIYGYATAAIAAFLFTAIPNWTGRPPVSGLLLLMLLLAWLGGRPVQLGIAVKRNPAIAAVA